MGDNVRVQKDVVTDSFVERLEDNAVFVCFGLDASAWSGVLLVARLRLGCLFKPHVDVGFIWDSCLPILG